jgi:hypothetical protein
MKGKKRHPVTGKLVSIKTHPDQLELFDDPPGQPQLEPGRTKNANARGNEPRPGEAQDHAAALMSARGNKFLL